MLPMSVGIAELPEYSNEVFERHATEGIRKIFEEVGEVRPMAEVMATISPVDMKKSDRFFSMTILPHVGEVGFDEDVKDQLAFLLRNMVQDFEAVAIMFASEGWMVRSSDLERMEKIQAPSEEPDRVEVVQIMMEFKRPTTKKLIFAEIKRPSKDRVELDQWQTFDGQGGGRFYGMFPPEVLN